MEQRVTSEGISRLLPEWFINLMIYLKKSQVSHFRN